MVRVQVRVGHRVLQIRGRAKVGEAVDPLHLGCKGLGLGLGLGLRLGSGLGFG